MRGVAEFSPQARRRGRDGAARPGREGCPACRSGGCWARPRRRRSMQRDADGGRAGGGGRERARLGRARLRDLQAEGRHGRRRGAGARGREAVGPQAQIRVDANGSWSVDEAVERLREMAPAGAGGAAGRDAGGDGRAARAAPSVPLAADESVVTAEDARARPRGVCDAATVKLAKVGGPLAALRIAERSRSTCRARSTGRSGSPPRRTWRRRSTTAGSPTASPPRCCSPTRSPRGSAPSRDGQPAPPRRSRPRSRDRRGRARAQAHRARLASRLGGRHQPQHRPCLGARRGAGPRRASRTRACRPGRAPPRLRWRCGRSPRSGCGATWTSAARASSRSASRSRPVRPVVVLTTSGTAGANLHPAVAEASEARVPLIVITADRPPELRGRGAGPDDRPAEAVRRLRCAGSASWASRGPTTPGCSTTARRRCGRSPSRAGARPGPCTSTCR